MRLSHWDFRPKRRSRYVAVGTAAGRPGSLWKRTGFRILLLGAFGLLVYLKYDAFVQSSLLQSLSRPGELWRSGVEKFRFRVVPPPPVEYQGAFSADSSVREWSCPPGSEPSCISAWSGLEEEEKGRIRSMVRKARLAWGAPETTGVTALFRNVPSLSGEDGNQSVEPVDRQPQAKGNEWYLACIRLEWPQGGLAVAPYLDPDGTERLCRLESGLRGSCLETRRPQPPLRTFQSQATTPERPPALDLAAPAGEIVRPILPGRVVALPADSAGWLKLHHGGSLFSYYSGFEPANHAFALGRQVSFGDTLGHARSPDSAAAPSIALRVRIEKDGSALDPLAFLGLESDSLHGR